MSEIRRYSLEIAAVYDTDVDMIKDDFGAYVEYRDHESRIKQLAQQVTQLEQELAEAKKLISAVDDLVTVKGRYHTEQRYRKMVAALDDYKAIAAGLPPF